MNARVKETTLDGKRTPVGKALRDERRELIKIVRNELSGARRTRAHALRRRDWGSALEHEGQVIAYETILEILTVRA